MTYYHRHGNRFIVTAKEAMDLQEKLPPATYTIKQDPMTGAYFLELIEGFSVGGKIYGDTMKTANRILSTFADRPNQTGVMLSGEKGSGKTLMAKLLSVGAMNQGIPTIVINEALYGEGFNSFIQSIEQPTVIIFDEFEKVYASDEQEKMLTLLDGVYPSKKLFILTCNDRYRVNDHMRNRPGRIYYRLDYTGLEPEFITEYCQDNLENKGYIESINRIATVFTQFNFDMLKAMVEEMNRYDESPQEVMKVLNAKPEASDAARYDVKLKVKDSEVSSDDLESDTWRGNPISSPIVVHFQNGTDEDDDPIWDNVIFTPSDLKKVDEGKFFFVKESGESVQLTKSKTTEFNWDAF